MKKRTTTLAVGVAVLALAGLGTGTAVAYVPTLFAPAGLTAEGMQSKPLPAPEYEMNRQGLTYGSAVDAISPETEPDLIQAVATNGKEGFVRKTELDAVNGTAAQASFKSPEDALKWQATEGAKDHVIPVYGVDGSTVLGEFLVVGQVTQSRGAGVK
ncbi:hypothetical protein [Microterricola viridarii]|uniref:Uncharacterized protein n=1 Tax=Microterricola viridarii TaxID=412690 RepID=A0A1H1VI88_9MICO|nr:hypothetical protein [Microterricola viridarii]SDS84568.1 hypothetical protein SAMN04489834_2272 [Microterricola viridarii]